MPDQTPFLGWPVPDPNTDPYYEAFLALITAIDASTYGPAREDRNLLLMGGGTVALSGSSNLSWGSAIELLAAPGGRLWTLAAGGATLQDGQMLVVELTRAPSSNVSITPQVVSSLLSVNADHVVVLAIRRGSSVYWRNGKVLPNGTSGPLFSAPGMTALAVLKDGVLIGSRPKLNFIGASVADEVVQDRVTVTVPSRGDVGQRFLTEVPLALGLDTDSTGYVVAGHRRVNVADFALAGTTVDVQLIAMGYASVVGVTGRVELSSLDAAFTPVVQQWAGVVTPTEVVTSVTLPSGNNRYRVRIQAAGSGDPSERFFLDNLVLRVRNTIT